MKLRRFTSLLIIGATAMTSALFTSCKSDGTVDELVGTYLFAGASMVNATDVSTDGTSITTLPAGEATYSSLFVTNGLYDPQLTPCSDVNNTRSELRKDGTLWLVCAGESGEKVQGSWTISDDRTQLSLTINGDFTTSGQPLEIIITGVTYNGLTLAGKITNFPLPKNLGVDLGATIPTGAGLAYEGEVNYQSVEINVSFTRVSL